MFRSILLAALVSAAVPLGAVAQTADDLKNDDKTPGDVLTYGMGYGQQRFSPLSQINRDKLELIAAVPPDLDTSRRTGRIGSLSAAAGSRL
jgi:alcohol dehydrogenase (cytochrome c)